VTGGLPGADDPGWIAGAAAEFDADLDDLIHLVEGVTART
jgi:hypothetical protein